MTNLINKMESKFGNFAGWVYQNRYLSLFIIFSLTAALLFQVSKLTIDTSVEAFYAPDDPVRVEYNEFRKRFGKDDHLYIGLNPAEVFDLTFLKKLSQLSQELAEKVPYVYKVTSLLNVRTTYGQDDELIVEDFIDPIPDTAEQLAALKSKAMASSLYRDYLLSEDGRFTFIDIELAVFTNRALPQEPAPFTDAQSIEIPLKYVSTEEYAEIMAVLKPILDGYSAQGLPIFLTGTPVINNELTQAMLQTMAKLTPLTIMLNILFLMLLFRRISGIVYPLLIVILTILSTVGVMAWLAIPIDLVTTILPTLLAVVGIADSVHLMSGFYQAYERNGGDKRAAITYAMETNGLAIFMTSVTTAVGLTSFIIADLAPISNLGKAAPIGVVLAFVYTVVLLPALIAIFPMSVVKSKGVTTNMVDDILNWVADVSCRRYKGIIICSALLFLFGLVGTSKLELSHNTLKWLPPDNQVRVDTSVIDSVLGGSVAIEVVINSGKKYGVYDPAFIQGLQSTAETIQALESDLVPIGKINSLHLVLKEVNQALHNNDKAFYVIPDNAELIAQELLLFEMSAAEDLHKLVSDDYSMVRFTVMLPFRDAFQLKPLVDKIKENFLLSYPGMSISVTGIGAMLTDTWQKVITTMFKSYGLALIGITMLMLVIIGRSKLGLMSMVPNLLPIILVMGIMGWTGLPFDLSNMLVGSVALGLIVDDTIHLMLSLKRNLGQSDDVKNAIKSTIQSTGRAIFITSLVLASGMAVSITADLRSTASFGLLTSSAVILALLADFFLVPAIVTAVYTRKWDRRNVVGES